MFGELILLGMGLQTEAPRTESDSCDLVRQQPERLTSLMDDLAQTSLSYSLALRSWARYSDLSKSVSPSVTWEG